MGPLVLDGSDLHTRCRNRLNSWRFLDVASQSFVQSLLFNIYHMHVDQLTSYMEHQIWVNDMTSSFCEDLLICSKMHKIAIHLNISSEFFFFLNFYIEIQKTHECRARSMGLSKNQHLRSWRLESECTRQEVSVQDCHTYTVVFFFLFVTQ